MTVQQLIAALRDMPPEATVAADSSNSFDFQGATFYIEGVELDEHGDVWLTEERPV